MTTASATKTGTNSQPTTAKVAPGKGAANPFLLPPDEQFWQRYSPHYEAPISGVSSFMIHFLIVGLIVGLAILAAIMGWNRSPDVPFQAVRIPGGGGGSPDGVGPAPGIGAGPKEDVNANDPADREPDPAILPDRAPLDAFQVKVAREVFDNDKDALRYINSGNQNLDAMMKNLNKDVLNKFRDGLQPGKGEGGPGAGGGEGTGNGPSKGPGVGSGKGTLTEREKRMLRWIMIFETHNPADYISQLNGLGAIVAVPTGRDQYSVVEDLNARPAKLVPKDVAALNRIYWVDDKPNSVHGVLQTLRIQMAAPHFVAFMPQELEERLGNLELAYQNLREEQIYETKFKVYKEGGAYNVKVTNQTRK